MTDRINAAVAEHIASHLGQPKDVLQELIPTSDLHIDIHVVAPTPRRACYTLVTSGMSAIPMAIPRQFARQFCSRAELVLSLPSRWRVDQLDDPRWNWPVLWLRLLAQFPHLHRSWLGVGHTVPNGENAAPFGLGTKLACWFLRVPRTTPEAFQTLRLGNREIAFLAPTPIHRSEMDFALANSPGSLERLDTMLGQAGVTELINPTRKAVV